MDVIARFKEIKRKADEEEREAEKRRKATVEERHRNWLAEALGCKAADVPGEMRWLRKKDEVVSLDDAEQLARIKAWRHQAMSSGYYWKARRTSLIDAIRRAQTERGAMAAFAQMVPASTDGGIAEVELRVAIEQALDLLPRQWAEVIEIRLIAPGYSDKDYAEMLDCTLDSYKSALVKARRKLRTLLYE